MDYELTSVTLGKPNHADLKLGLATAPALYAWEEFPEMGELIRRQFESPGDPEKVKDSIWTIHFFRPFCLTCPLFQARELVSRSSAIPRTRQLAQTYADEAKNVLQNLPPSEARDMLEVLADRVVMMGDQLKSGCREAEKYRMPTNECPPPLPSSSATPS